MRRIWFLVILVGANTSTRTSRAEDVSDEDRRKAIFVVVSSRSSRITAFQRMKAFDELRARGESAVALLKSAFDDE